MATPLDDALDALAEALIHGRFDQIAGLTSLLEEALSKLEAPAAEDLDRLGRKAARNAACIDSALAGLRAGQARVSDIKQAGLGLTTYDRKGATALITLGPLAGRRA